jgi:hypothetical protein
VESQNAGSAALAALKTAKNKPDEPDKIAVEFTFNAESKKISVQV